MKKLLLAVLAVVMMCSFAYADWVNGYTKSNGTYVSGYNRSSPNSTVQDNYSYKGNTNPYTGQQGTNYNRDNPTSAYYGTSGRSNKSMNFSGSLDN